MVERRPFCFLSFGIFFFSKPPQHPPLTPVRGSLTLVLGAFYPNIPSPSFTPSRLSWGVPPFLFFSIFFSPQSRGSSLDFKPSSAGLVAPFFCPYFLDNPPLFLDPFFPEVFIVSVTLPPRFYSLGGSLSAIPFPFHRARKGVRSGGFRLPVRFSFFFPVCWLFPTPQLFLSLFV